MWGLPKRAARSEHGFTLMELIIVIMVIGILSTLALVSIQSAQAKARDSKRRHDIASIRRALIGYSIDTGSALVQGAGKTGTGNDGLGWFNLKGTADYNGQSIEEALRNLGYIGDGVVDPRDQENGYVIFPCAGSEILGVFVTLEDPSATDAEKAEAWTARGCPEDPFTAFNKNAVELIPLNN